MVNIVTLPARGTTVTLWVPGSTFLPVLKPDIVVCLVLWAPSPVLPGVSRKAGRTSSSVYTAGGCSNLLFSLRCGLEDAAPAQLAPRENHLSLFRCPDPTSSSWWFAPSFGGDTGRSQYVFRVDWGFPSVCTAAWTAQLGM